MWNIGKKWRCTDILQKYFALVIIYIFFLHLYVPYIKIVNDKYSKNVKLDEM